MTRPNDSADANDPVASSQRPSALAHRHLRVGWWALLGFLSLGLVLEALHGLKVGHYLDAGNEARRLSLRLAHAHGTLLSLVHVAFALTLGSGFAPPQRQAERASVLLVAATLLLPGGFLLGGLFLHGADPGIGVFLVPFGALALFVSVLGVARGVSRPGAARELEVREIRHGSSEYDASAELRTRVLRTPLGLARSPEERDEEAPLAHLGAFEGDRLVGCLMLQDLGDGSLRMRQVAVEFDRQRRGIGKALVARSEAWARARGFSSMVLHARHTAVSFYAALGYEAFGEPFVEVTIPHRRMKKSW